MTDDEVTLARVTARLGDAGTRSLQRAVCWALAEATAVTSEISAIRVRDVDDARAPRWVQLPGTRRPDPRAGELTDWGSLIVARQVQALTQARHTSATLLTYKGRGAPGEAGAQASVCNAIGAVLDSAGLAREPDVRPASVRNWAGRRLYDSGLPLEQVALRWARAPSTPPPPTSAWMARPAPRREHVMGREHMNTLTRMRAVLSSPSLYQLASCAAEWERPVGRRRVNPTYVTLATGSWRA